ncbi:MerC mercury resistance protein [Luteibacter sp. UNCMF331Sha3.1]|uniref:MerC domain-containing protein n=1 Tax=Luteibacter sp. UNCMF331Sha3.1 TaxID=1502760 RepID=UPI0008CDC5E6|nr:MerC domain-containing protein [Luteibacter sp. UNCMF331Sha3.1]SEM17070.1 MerC mercury resistance protein [Luteibacter sp. UNCMF331Sha3.1]
MTESLPESDVPRRWWHAADRLGATASFLCAIHCAALPFVIALLPLIGLSFLADHRFEAGFVGFACVLASFAVVSGYRRHRRRLPLMLAAPGLLLLILGVTFLHGGSLLAHSILVTCGGFLVAAAHFVNLRVDRGDHAGHIHGPSCAHP